LQQYLDTERAYFRLTDAEHRAQAQQFELGLADEALTAEAKRLDAALQICPGPRQPLTASPSNALRDGIRVRAQGDPVRLEQVAHVALADWYARRASGSGDTRFCDLARAARSQPPATQSTPDLLAGLPAATVSRDQRQMTASPALNNSAHLNSSAPPSSAPPPSSGPPSGSGPPSDSGPKRTDAALLTLSSYALGSIDVVHAAAPLPQYLALVYGGFLSTAADAPAAVDAETAAATVDRDAPAYPDWEPDALYAALRGGQP
jgi:hypothetical protein